MRLFGRKLVALDHAIDLSRIGAVVGNGRLNKLNWLLEIGCRRFGVSVVVANRRDDLPDVEPRSYQRGPSPHRPVREANERMLIYPQSLFDVTLCKRPRGLAGALCAMPEVIDG